MEKWIDFYEPFFISKDEAVSFVNKYEELCPGGAAHTAKIIMHQTKRLVSLADDIPNIRKGNETIPLLFLLVCAEHTAKLYHNFESEGQSKVYVRRFFNEFVNEDDKRVISTGITKHDRKPLPIQDAIDILYSVRCDLVHEGRYWGFHFHDGKMPILGTDPDVITSITFSTFREIVVRGCIEAINTYDKES